MRHLFPTLLITALAAAGSSGGHAATDSVGRDAEVAAAQPGRVAITLDANNRSHLAIASRTAACETGFGVHQTQDDGVTWQRNCMPQAPDASDVPAVAIKKGRLIAMQPMDSDTDGGSLRASLSIDGGGFQEWRTVAASHYPHGMIFNPRAEVDHAAASPYRGEVYVSYTDDERDGGRRSQIRVGLSWDGLAWNSVQATPEAQGDEQLDFSALAIDRYGQVFLTYLSCTGPQAGCRGQPAELRMTRSSSGGASWTAPNRLATIQLPKGETVIDAPLQNDYGALPGTHAAVSYTPAIAVDVTRGAWANRLYVAMTTHADGRLQVLLTTSDDMGVSWTTPRPVASGPRAADQFMPWVSVSHEGVVAVTWMDQRQHPKRADYQPMVAFSTDGGATFSTPAVLQREASDPVALKDLRGSASHVWSGQRLKTAFIGPDAAGAPSLRLSTARP